ncbi:MAG: hypothetical protein FWG30_06715 [Eubacteriaceae bacterium]|nr:hypothetical protein [Eubacteriaceae bacterium]
MGTGRNIYSKLSLAFSASPLALWLAVFIFCLVFSGGKLSDNDSGAIWWLFFAATSLFIFVAPFTSVLSAVFGIIGIIRSNTQYAWAGIIVAIVDVAAILLFIKWLKS